MYYRPPEIQDMALVGVHWPIRHAGRPGIMVDTGGVWISMAVCGTSMAVIPPELRRPRQIYPRRSCQLHPATANDRQMPVPAGLAHTLT